MLSSDPVAAALLGMFVELARYVPTFAREGERPEDAVARVRPLAVVLLDGTLDAARSDLFFAAAARAKAGLAIFGTSGRAPVVAARALARGVPVLPFPSSLAEMERLLARAQATPWWSRTAERRRPPAVPFLELGVGGELLYHDRAGRRWSVYDRRGVDRRRADAGNVLERVFVSEAGEVRTYQLADDEAAARHPDELEAQLARALPQSS